MIKRFSDLQDGDKFLFIDIKKDIYLFEMISRTNEASIQASQIKDTAKHLFGRIWRVDCDPDKRISVYARAK